MLPAAAAAVLVRVRREGHPHRVEGQSERLFRAKSTLCWNMLRVFAGPPAGENDLDLSARPPSACVSSESLVGVDVSQLALTYHTD